ncbi:HD-GYP domain-containing protein [Treponema sp.]|uniref:HD-GYP domain-containing protein n=1 Tax=Treponema sp. TaxID=166 RepID=UPI00388FC214
MVSFQVSELNEGKRFSSRVVLDKQFVVLDSNIPFSRQLQNRLIEWGFKEVFSDGEAKIEEPVQTRQNFESVDLDLDELNNEFGSKSSELNSSLKTVIEKANSNIKNFPNKDRMEDVTEVYNEFIKYTQAVFTRYVTHTELKQNELSDSIRLLIEFIRANKKFILRIQPSETSRTDKNFLISHCLRTTIYSIIIALQINMPVPKIIELGIAALIHEIGQIKLPPQLYLTDRPLLPQARNLLATHTVLGFNILKESNFPLSIQLGVLEHHERENGQGYPRKLTGNKISAYGKILSVACSYEAITAPRQYKEARTTFEATLEMLKNENKQYDDTVIKALVSAVSLFPIGSYVYLANGKVAQVTESNPNDPRLPIVELITEKNELGKPKVIMTDTEKYRIARVLNKEELKGLLAYLK